MLKTIASEIIEFLLWIIHLIWNELILGWIYILFVFPFIVLGALLHAMGVNYRLMRLSAVVTLRAKFRLRPR